MHRILPWLVTSCLLVASAQAQSTAQQASATQPAPSGDEAIKRLRAELQSNRAELMAKNLPLTAAQAAKFWPLFEEYQKQQNVIMDAQLKALQKYVESSETLDDAGALALINAHLEKDTKMANLRRKWLGEFQKVLPTKLAVRAIQVDRRLSLAAQAEIASQIPLVH